MSRTVREAARENPELYLWVSLVDDLLEFSHFPKDESIRALLLLLADTCMHGDLCMRLDDLSLTSTRDRFVQRHDTTEPNLEDAIVAAKSIDRYSPLIGKDETSPVVFSDTFLFFQKYFLLRRNIERDFARMAAQPPRPLEKAKEAYGTALSVSGLSLSVEQKLAVALSLFSSFVIITGGPGTGKTTVIRVVLDSFLRAGIPADRVILCAPTGRAARRMAETLGDQYTASTIHTTLSYRRDSQDFYFGPNRKLIGDVLVVDEVSMVDVDLMSRLLAAVDPTRTRVILIGDRNQLPSVDAGAVLGDLVELFALSGNPQYSPDFASWLRTLDPELNLQPMAGKSPAVDRMVHLTASHRSADAVIRASDAVRKAEESLPWSTVPLGELPENHGVAQIAFRDGGQNEVLGAWLKLSYGREFVDLLREASALDADDPAAVDVMRHLTEATGRARILSALRQTEDGSVRLNRRMMKLFLKQNRSVMFGEWFSGLPLMITRNDYSRELFNGETGLLVRFRTGFRWIAARGEAIRLLPPESLPECEPAFVTTVHKSQGSEYSRVLLWLPESDHPMVSRQILYTALTRAKELVWIYGKEKVLRAGIQRNPRRETGGLSLDSTNDLYP